MKACGKWDTQRQSKFQALGLWHERNLLEL